MYIFTILSIIHVTNVVLYTLVKREKLSVELSIQYNDIKSYIKGIEIQQHCISPVVNFSIFIIPYYFMYSFLYPFDSANYTFFVLGRAVSLKN